MRRLFLLPLLVGCTDYSFTGEGKPGRPEDTGELPDPIDSGTPDIPDTPGEEECNGVDDDGDGEIDEGYPDTDLDGIKDCLDDDCSVDDFTAFDVTVDEDCLAPDIEVQPAVGKPGFVRDLHGRDGPFDPGLQRIALRLGRQ